MKALKKRRTRRVGILTAGGDAPALNAVIRAVVRSLRAHGVEVIGIKDGFRGLVEGAMQPLEHDDVMGILALGGSILGTSNKDNPFRYLDESGKKPVFRDRSFQAMKQARTWDLEGLIVLGGDGSQAVSHELAKLGLPCIGVPKTIDNDVWGTDISFGFDSAVSVATEAIDRLHTVASSHHRVMVVEVMGRTTGWLALASGLAAGADIILIPEIHCDFGCLLEAIRKRRSRGRSSSIVVASEGAKPFGKAVVKSKEHFSVEPLRLGGVGELVAGSLQKALGAEARAVTLGHVVRGGTPTAFDRNLATCFGVEAANLAVHGKWNRMVCLRQGAYASLPLASIAGKTRLVPLDHPWLKAARETGVTFGC